MCKAGTFSSSLSAPTCTPCPSGKYNVDAATYDHAYAKQVFESQLHDQKAKIAALSSTFGNSSTGWHGEHAEHNAARSSIYGTEAWHNNSTEHEETMDHGGRIQTSFPRIHHATETWAASMKDHHVLSNAPVSCLACPAMTWTEGKNGQTHCVTIPTPYPTAAPSDTPTAYPTAAPTASPTTACVPGRFRDTASTCAYCPGGQTTVTYNAPSCGNCPHGKFSAEGSDACTDCPIGQFLAVGYTSDTCSACLLGTYNEWEGQTNCYH